MTEALDIEKIIEWIERIHEKFGPTSTQDAVDILIADWRAKKAEIERLKTSRDLCEKELDVLSASHKDLAHRLARSDEDNERLRTENAELKVELVKRLRALADATLPQ